MTIFTFLLIVHIAGAVVGLLSGYLAMILRKGSGPHGAAGSVFFVSMLLMSASAAYIAAFHKPVRINLIVGLLTFYLVATAWRAARRRDVRTGLFDLIGFLFISFVAAAGLASAAEAAGTAGGLDGMPSAIFIVFGSIALLCAVSDLRIVRAGSIDGRKRITRHLWRMCLALLIATASLYPGNAGLFPLWLRETKLLFIPHVLLIGSMLFWRIRYATPRLPQVQRGDDMKLTMAAQVLICILAPAAVLAADENRLTDHNRSFYGSIQKILLTAAEQMPEEHYDFKPVESVRTFGQIVGHVADSQYFFCSTATGEKNPGLRIEKTRATKSELIAALRESFAYCSSAYAGLDDASAVEPLKMMGRENPKLAVFSTNHVHTMLHYGNLVTYMRMKDVIPPTSDEEFMRQLRK